MKSWAFAENYYQNRNYGGRKTLKTFNKFCNENLLYTINQTTNATRTFSKPNNNDRTGTDD